MPTPIDARGPESGHAVLELAAHDPMAAVRHVAACLARRAYPLLGLACLPRPDGTTRLVVAVTDDGRLSRLLAELAGLPEIFAARLGDPGAPILAALAGNAAMA
ncbi:conserved hypothetical protein [Solidesulfovibrio fructosivorans JJ]]|uniref:Uncharacterized protein n=1 Tax=Solidesulfovibrio fructosivorans JJ] TaxID=596151 RepID=E1K003_SOLFR|nr:hypothetical protein [Solidesulfovibrio fructosivorans]EFL50098.1 conserved hypothetical protein [Solidesulfovibrio fructosivorans JJ]]